MMLAWDHWHIEPSSICTLKCPRCPRAEVPDSLLNQQLTLNFFKNQVGADTIKQIKKITFCGNDGDPIYCKDFLNICSWIKQINPEIHLVLITNGSYKPTVWWEQLGEIFNANDEIHWSLDGWDQESNEQYRVNCDWDSIMNGINTFNQANTTTYRVWASIAFKFNEKQLLRQKITATASGFDSYQLTKSTKFSSKYPAYGDNDPLEPEDVQMIASGHRFERIIQALTTKQRPGIELKNIFLERSKNLGNHSGICLIGNKGVFLNSQGEFYPCCWTANRYEHNQSWHNRANTQFNLNTRTFQEIIADKFWTTEFLEFNSQECKTKCTPGRLTDRQHTTEW
jgi:MoaA/NifB/PqqE/SkfB family radical SAM enzyme